MDVKKLLGTLFILVLVITAFGCKKEVKPLSPEEAAKPAKDIREKTVTVEEDVLGWGKSTLKVVSDLKCDVQGEKGLFSFKLSNPTDTTYVMKKVSAFETNINPLKIKINGRVFDYSYCRDGGADVTTLEPGAVRICTREFAPTDVNIGDFMIRTGMTKLGTPVENRMLVMTSDFTSEVMFKCD